MDVLFLHPNFPGQFRRLAVAMAAMPDFRVWGLGSDDLLATSMQLPGVRLLKYPAPAAPLEAAHPWARSFEQSVRRGEEVVRTLGKYKRLGLEPDIIVAHPGWGDAFFVRDFFPGARVIGYFEYYYRARGADVGFDPEFPAQMSDIFRIHASNSTQLLALESCDQGICPTEWQKSRFPSEYAGKLKVQHEGIDTQKVRPDLAARFTLNDGRTLTRENEVLTFVARNLEPYRGFHVFMRALPRIQRERPNCQIVVVGGDGCSYGNAPRDGGSWKDACLQELEGQLDLSRIHFTGSLAFDDYVSVLQVSTAHIYLTYPFVLSWSALEAMSAGCIMVASDTAPVKEFISDGSNGLLVPFKDHDALAEKSIEVLKAPQAFAHLGRMARQTAVSRVDFESVCWPEYRKILELD